MDYSAVDFDEANERLMEFLAAAVSLVAAECAPSVLLFTDRPIGESGPSPSGKRNLTFHVANGTKVQPHISEFLRVLDSCMGPLYVENNGRNWKKDKLDEMATPGLVYVWYTTSAGDVACFLSFMVVDELEGRTLYLFEIQVLPPWQGLGIGRSLMEVFHSVATRLKAHPNHHLNVVSTALTVFSKNQKALQWYRKLGYSLTQHSPRDRVLRTGSVPPPYYILARPV